MGGLWKWHRQHISWWPAGVSKPKHSKVQRDLVLVRPIHFSFFSFEYRSNQPLPNCICPFHLHETIQCCDRALNLALALMYFRISPDLLNRNRHICTTQTFCTRRSHRMSELVHILWDQRRSSRSHCRPRALVASHAMLQRHRTNALSHNRYVQLHLTTELQKCRRHECNREHMHA